MSVTDFIDMISKTQIVDKAIPKVNEACDNKNNHPPLYAAIDALLPQDYDRKAFFDSFGFNKDKDEYELFNKFFKSPKYFSKESIEIKGWLNKNIVLVAIAFIGLDYSGEKDRVDNIKKDIEEKNRKFRKHTKFGRALNKLLEEADVKKIAECYEFKQSSSNEVSQEEICKVLNAISEKLSSLIQKSKLGEFLSNRMDDIFFITTFIVGLAVIAGVVNNYKKSSETNNSSEKPEHSEPVNASEPPVKVEPAIMAVVIPANKLGSETKEGMDISDAIRFIDAAVYFACFPMDTAKEIETKLDLKEDQILLDSAQDIYVSLKTEDGHDLIDASLKFSLKKSLRNKPRDFRITKIRLLDKLRGLDRFNRI